MRFWKLTDWSSQVDSSQNTKIENGRSVTTLMNEPTFYKLKLQNSSKTDLPDISNRSRNKSLKRTHTESLNNSRSNQRSETFRGSSPETCNHQTNSGDKVNRSLAVLDSKRIANETAKGNGNNDTTLHTLNER